MKTGLLGSVGMAAALRGGVLMWATASGQGSGAAAPPLVITAYGGKPPAAKYVTPRTPWGDPDLQGVWSSDDNDGIPMSRPQQYGDRLYLNEQEMAERATRIQQNAQRGDTEAASVFRGDFGRRAFPQTSLIVDPPDGRMPAYTSEGQKRPMPRGTY